MRRTTRIYLALLAASAVALQSGVAHAADEDTQFWLVLTANAAIGNGDTLAFDVSPRARSDTAGDDQMLVRASFDHQAAAWLKLGVGGAYVALAGGDEWRTHQQATFGDGPVTLRTRLEERFFSGADRPQLRLRERLRASLPVASQTSLELSGELLAIVRSQTRGAPSRIDQWRLSAAVRHQLAKHVELGAGYMLAVAPVAEGPDRLSHIPMLMLSYTF